MNQLSGTAFSKIGFEPSKRNVGGTKSDADTDCRRAKLYKIADMKAFVTGYSLKPEFIVLREQGESIPNQDSYDISYNIEPNWQFLWRPRAEMELDLLEAMQPHVGDHYCKLEIEHLGKEEYAIVCNDHPELHSHENWKGNADTVRRAIAQSPRRRRLLGASASRQTQ